MSSGLIHIREIPAIETYTVRHPVLRKNRPVEDCKFDGDNLKNTFHLGLFYDDELIGVASFIKKNHALLTDKYQYQLRGMAVLDAYQGKKLGNILFRYGEELLQKKDITTLWFNARENAVAFYQKNGCTIIGAPFEIEGIGTHYVMFKKLTA